MDFIVWLPIIFRLVEFAPKVIAALRSGGNVFEIISQLGPDALSFFEQIGGAISPGASRQAKIELGALKTFDPKRVREIQEEMNKHAEDLGVEAIDVDGDYGPKTTALVKAFQTKYMKEDEVDGWAGHLTMEKAAELRGEKKEPAKAEPKAKK